VPLVNDTLRELALLNKTKVAVARIFDWHAAIRALLEDCRDRTTEMGDTVKAIKQSHLDAQVSINEALKGL
jgi:hypothetical protein